MDPELVKILGGLIQPGLAGALLILMWVVGNRLVTSLDRVGTRLDSLGTKVDDHRTADLASHSDFGDRIAGIEGAIMRMGINDDGPSVDIRTPPFGNRTRRGQ